MDSTVSQASALPRTGNTDFSSRVLTDMSTGVLVLSDTGVIRYVNPPAANMLELDMSRLPEGKHFHLITADRNNDEFSDYILNAIQNKTVTHKGMVRYTAPGGKAYVFRMSSSYLSPSESDERGEIVITLTDETRAAEMRRKYIDASHCFSITVFAVCLWIMIYAAWRALSRPFSLEYMTHGAEVLGLIMMYFVFRYTSFTRQEMGIVAENPKKTIVTALLISAATFVFLVLVKLVGRLIDPTLFEPNAPFIDFSRFGWQQLIYIPTAGLQEFIARSIIQNNIRRIMVGRHSALFAILLSSLIFAVLHVQFGFFFMLGAAVLCGLEGILYEKQHNIFGVWIVHWFFGVAGTLLCLVEQVH